MERKVKKIAFYSVGFAFNRLVRMYFYEKIFPKDVEIFLITTNKYIGREKEFYQQKYEDHLKRAKVVYLNYNRLTLPFQLRRFCKENKIDRLMNVGGHLSAFFFIFATLGTKADYCVNILSDMLNQHKLSENLKNALWYFVSIPLTFPLVRFSKKTTFTDSINFRRAQIVFLRNKKKMAYLAAPLSMSLFKIKDKAKVRKKLGLPKDKKIITYVGRVTYSRGSDFLKELIKKHPDYYFIIIGRMMDKDFSEDRELIKLKGDRYELISMKSSEELVDYYNAADMNFNVNREGGGPGLVAEESLACGTPTIVSELFRLKKSKALYQVPLKFEEIDRAIAALFNLSEEEKNKLKKIARKYIQDNYSEDVWKKEYIKVYLDR
ncbi:glycosyltransferase family 4 protein [Candidatus Pacearchaeota archaeon]|nr:glycosyltransferase family 4 protein [Candidatus Pacearchaeota archaeon]